MNIYTDGACSGNPGKGGWAFVVEGGKAYYGSLSYTTNNQMELEAAIQAMIFLENQPGQHVVFTDSKYVYDGLLSWMPNWQKNNWVTSAKKPVLNKEYWIRLSDAYEKIKNNVELKWVKGHDTNLGNNLADLVAVCSVNNHEKCKCPMELIAV